MQQIQKLFLQRTKRTQKELLSLKAAFACSTKKNHGSYITADGRLTDLGASIEAERCLLCVDAPCAKACPADTKPDKFLRQLRFENPLGAAETVLDNNPLGGVCGSVCPVSKLCEGACTRQAIDGPVKIGAVQRYLHDYGLAQKLSLPPIAKGVKHSTAVIGAGPAGLAAARELARRGSRVTVFERRPQAGGALRYALSPLRISHALVEEEVQRIKEMGVSFRFNQNVSNIAEIMREGQFDALFVSPGLQASRSIAIQQKSSSTNSNNNNRIVGALSFLSSANESSSSDSDSASLARSLVQDQSVVIVGGGSVAMDCAITARALGAREVHLLAREKLLEFPADEEEIRLAREAGAIFHPQSEILSLDPELRIIAYESPSFSGKLEAGAIIVAAGQMLDETGRQLLASSEEDPRPSYSSYVGGDAARVATGGATVVEAVADGKRAAAAILPDHPSPVRVKPSLQIDFLGLSWENPFTLSSSPVSNSAEMIARAYEAGFSGAYYKTLNREDRFEISHPSPRLGVVHPHHPPGGGEMLGIQNLEQISDRPLADNLRDISWLRQTYPSKRTAVSIMGYCDEDWRYLAQAAEGAGAHLLELNFSCPQMARSDAGHHVGQQFDLIERYTAVVKRAVQIPVIAKLTPNITDMIPAALAAQAGGADAISTINTLKSISHVDLSSFQSLPTVAGQSAISGFSGKACRPFGLRFISELAREPRLKIPLSGMGGIYSWKDSVEYLALGASNLQVTTAVMQHGYRIVEDLIDGLQQYLLKQNKVERLQDLVGRANASIVQPAQLDVSQEVVSVIDPQLCIGCGVCAVSCSDGAAQAISLVPSHNGVVAEVDSSRCVGCKLCQFVCPVGAISFQTRPRIPRPRFSK